MKQIGLGLMQYTQDYDEKMPMFVPQMGNFINNFNTNTDPTFINWQRAIYPYTKSYQINVCPSATPAAGTAGPNGINATNYTGNGVVMQKGLSLAAIDEVSTVIAVQERDMITHTAELYPDAYGGKYRYWLLGDNVLHFNGSNLLFCDGHAKWKSIPNICVKDFGLVEPAAGTENSCGIQENPNTVLLNSRF